MCISLVYIVELRNNARCKHIIKSYKAKCPCPRHDGILLE